MSGQFKVKSIECAREWLAGALHREFKAYIARGLAGDFACAIVELFERKDARIAELVDQLKTADSACFVSIIENKGLQAELAAIKAQEPVWSVSAEIAAFESFDYADRCFRLRREGQRYVYAATEKELELFRAGAKWGASLRPVSEAKPQGEGFKPEELRIDTYHADEHSGFLHTNQTAVRITHLPTGAIVESKDERSVHRNKQKCLDMLPAAIEAKAQRTVLPEQEGSDAQISFWAGFEFSVSGLHNSNIRAAWNDFKSSEQFKRMGAAAGKQASVPDDGMICVNKRALGAVLKALVNAPHHIRELQATREPVELFSDNPINILVDQFNSKEGA